MITGLQVTLDAVTLYNLCRDRADHHEERAKTYATQAQGMEDVKIEGTGYTGGDPVKALRDKEREHDNAARELDFIADHLDKSETYLLSRDDLRRLGVISADRW